MRLHHARTMDGRRRRRAVVVLILDSGLHRGVFCMAHGTVAGLMNQRIAVTPAAAATSVMVHGLQGHAVGHRGRHVFHSALVMHASSRRPRRVSGRGSTVDDHHVAVGNILWLGLRGEGIVAVMTAWARRLCDGGIHLWELLWSTHGHVLS